MKLQRIYFTFILDMSIQKMVHLTSRAQKGILFQENRMMILQFVVYLKLLQDRNIHISTNENLAVEDTSVKIPMHRRSSRITKSPICFTNMGIETELVKIFKKLCDVLKRQCGKRQ